MDDDEEAIEVSGSPFAPASDYLGKRLGSSIGAVINQIENYSEMRKVGQAQAQSFRLPPVPVLINYWVQIFGP